MVQTTDDPDNKELTHNPTPAPDAPVVKKPASDAVQRFNPAPIWIALVLVTAAAAGGGYWLHQQTGQHHQTLAAVVEKQATDIASLQNARQDVTRQLESALLDFKQVSAERDQAWRDFNERVNTQLAEQSRRLAQLSSSSRARFLIDEARFLMRQANQRLHLEKSTESAERLMVLADGLLAQAATELGNPAGLLAVRKQIAADMQALNAVTDVDYSGIYYQMDALMGRMDGLALAAAPRQFEGEPNVKKWQREADNLWEEITFAWRRFAEELTAFVRVRRYDKPVEPLMPPEHEANLRANIKNQLQTAQWALLRNDSRLYQASIGRAVEWMRSYFPVSPERDQLADALTQLQALNVSQTLPDISGSNQALETFRAQLRFEQEAAQ